MRIFFYIFLFSCLYLNSAKAADVIDQGTNCGQNCSWSLDEDGNLIIKGSGNITLHPWTAHTDIKTVSIQDGLSSIPYAAFFNLNQITEVDVPRSVKSIGAAAFQGTKITSINLPEGIETIERAAFDGTLLNELTLPSTLKSIGNNAFSGTKIKNVTLPEGTKSIGQQAFANTLLESVELPSSLETIGKHAFWSASALKEIIIPGNVSTIASNAFEGASKLEKVVFEQGSKVKSLEYGAFMGDSKLTTIALPDELETIGERVFFGCSQLRNLVIPDSLTSIGSQAFYEVSLAKITCSEENLSKYLNALGGFQGVPEIVCTKGACENALKGTKYEGKVNITYPLREEVQADGSIAIYRHGKFVGFKNKRIYSVDEAEMLSKPTGNKFRIRYR